MVSAWQFGKYPPHLTKRTVLAQQRKCSDWWFLNGTVTRPMELQISGFNINPRVLTTWFHHLVHQHHHQSKFHHSKQQGNNTTMFMHIQTATNHTHSCKKFWQVLGFITAAYIHHYSSLSHQNMNNNINQ